MPIAPVLPPPLEFLRLKALDQALAIIDQAAASKGLPPPSVFMKTAASDPNSLNALTVMAAMRLVLHEAFVLVTARVQMEVRKPNGTVYAIKYNYRPPPPEEPVEIVVDINSILSLEKLFI